MGDGAQYSTSTREPIGLPSISTFTPLLNSNNANNGFRDQHSPRFTTTQHTTTHTTTTSSSSSSNTNSAAAAADSNSRPFSASISFAPLSANATKLPVMPKRDGPPHPSHSTTIYNPEPVPLGKKKVVSPLKKHSPIPKNGPPPAKKIALTPLSPPKNGSNGNGGGGGGGAASGMPALEAALRSPVDADARRMPAPPPGAIMGATSQQSGAPMAPRGGPPTTMHQAVGRPQMDVSLDGLIPFNPNEEGGMMQNQPTSNGNNGYGYAPSPSNGHRGYFGETPRDSPLTTLAPLEPLTTSFSTHSPVQHNGNNSYFNDWSNPSLASPMALPPLNTIFSGHSNMDQPHSSQYSSSPISVFSDPSPSASLLSISLPPPHQQQQQQQSAAATRPQSRPAADFGHYSGPLSHQSSSSIVWDEPPPPPTPTTTTHAAMQATTHAVPMGGGGGHPKSGWTGGVLLNPSLAQKEQKDMRRVKVLPGFESPQKEEKEDPVACSKIHAILANAKAAESYEEARKQAELRGEPIPPPPTAMRADVKLGGIGKGKGKGAREAEKRMDEDPESFERREKKRIAQNEARRKKRDAQKEQQDRMKAESSHLGLYPVHVQQQHPPYHHHPHPQHPHPHTGPHPQGPRPMQQPLLQLSMQQQPMRQMAESSEASCSVTASINAVVARLDKGAPHDPSRTSSTSFNASTSSSSSGAGAAAGGDHPYSELRAAMLAEEVPLVISRKESSSMLHPPPQSSSSCSGLAIAAVNPMVRQSQPPQQQPPLPPPQPASASHPLTPHALTPHPLTPHQLMRMKLVSGIQKARAGLMKQYHASLGINPLSSKSYADVVLATRKVEAAQQQAEWEVEQMQRHCALLAEQTKLQHITMQRHLKRIANGEDTTDLPTTALPGQAGVMREGFSLRSMNVLDQEIRCRREGIDPSESRRGVAIAAVLTPPSAPAAALRMAGAADGQVKTEAKETATASTMTDKEEKRDEKPSRRMMNDQSTRPLERCYLAGVKELIAEGYAVREGGMMVRPREPSSRNGHAPSTVHLVDTDGKVWSEAIPHSSHQRSTQNGVQSHQQRRNEEGEGGGDERSSGRVLRSAHRHTPGPGYH